MKLLVFTDSRGQHRPAGQLYDIFGERLSQLKGINVDLVLCPMKWTTTIDFLEYMKTVPMERYDCLILYTGIVDWSPRAQPSAINDVYNNPAVANERNIALNTFDYSKKVVNNKKAAFDQIFGEDLMRRHLSSDYGVEYEGCPTINMYSMEMAEKYLIPRLCQFENLLFINSNSFVYGWNGDYKRRRPENIHITRSYSEKFRDLIGPTKTIDLLAWDEQDVRRYTCDNLHLTRAGSDYIFEHICRRLKLGSTQVSVTHPLSRQKGDLMGLKYPLQTPRKIDDAERMSLLSKTGNPPEGKLATLIIGFRIAPGDESRSKSLMFLLSWIDRFYGCLFDVLLVEQDSAPRFENQALKPYVRYQFLYNPEAYNRGWGYNSAIRHMTNATVVVCMDTDILPGNNFVDEIVDCYGKYDAISPYTNIYYSDVTESASIRDSFSIDTLSDQKKIKNPTTLAGGILIIRRSIFEAVAGFEQYRGYSCEDRALDVTLYNHCNPERIRMAPFSYVHLYHGKDTGARKDFNEIYGNLVENYGCKYDPSLTPADFIHKSCNHVSRQRTLSNLIARRLSYGDVMIYRSGKQLTVNGCYKTGTGELPDKLIFPTNFSNLIDYPAKELYVAPDPDTDELSAFYNAFKGKRCFIIGNGPSLNKHDLSLLEGEYTFGVNSFYYKTEETGFRPYFFVVEDSSVMKENIERIISYEVPFKFFPTNYKSLHPKMPNTFFFRMNRGFYEKSSLNFVVPRFSTDASKVLYCGQSVTYINLQLAFYMGFSEVFLIGMDFSYTIPDTHKRTGDVLLSDSDDPNHFHKDYFGKGKTWKDPKLDRVALNYRQAKLVYEAVGRKIYNATIGGELEVFDRADYDQLLRNNQLRLSPAIEIRSATNQSSRPQSPESTGNLGNHLGPIKAANQKHSLPVKAAISSPVKDPAVAPVMKGAVAASVIARPSPSNSSDSARLFMRMGESIEGNHWSAPGKIEWDSVRWATEGQRATLALPIKRDREMLVAVACHPAGGEDRLDGLKVEIDGVAVPHTVHLDLNPVCLIVRMPARTETSHTPTELALVVPAAPKSVPVNGKPLGLAVSAVSVLPTRPENMTKPELSGPRWSRPLMRLIDRRGKAKLPFPFSHFDGVSYLAENPDVAENVLAGRMPSALFHYQRYGLKEQRRLALALTRHPNQGGLADMFDGCAYLEAYPDVAAAVRSESIPSALEHYVIYGRTEGRKVSTSFDGSACRGTALDLVRLEAGRELKATLHGVKQQLSQDLAAQIGQVGSRLTKMESALSSLARATDLEAARAEFRKDLTLCARTADLQTVRRDLTAALDALRQEAEKRAGELAGEIRDRFSTAARATDVARVEQATAQTMERLRARIGELERTEQQEKERLERLHGELETVRIELNAQALTLRQELEHGLAERVRMAEFQRLEQLSLTRIEQLRSELTDADRLASQRAERLQGDMEIIWQELESDAVALRQDLTSAFNRLRGEREVREGELAQEIQEGLSRAARASELVRVEQLGKQSMEQLYAAVRTMKGELEAKDEALQQELQGGLAERVPVSDLEQMEQRARARMDQWQTELDILRDELGAKSVALRERLEQGLDERVRVEDLERMEHLTRDHLDRLHAELQTVRDELGAKACALREALEQGLEERVRADDLGRMEHHTSDRLDKLQAELETVREELGVKAVAFRQELEQGLGERVRVDDLERMELFTGNRLERLHAELETVRGELGSKAIGLRQELEQGLKDRARHDELERVEQRAGDRWERLQAELAALASVREARESAITSQLETVKAGFELAATKVELADVKQRSLQRDLEREADLVRSQVAGIDTRLSSADASVQKLSEDLEQVEKQQTIYKSRLTHPNLYAFNVIGYQSFARQLTVANAGRLAKHWGPLLGVTIPEKELFYLAHRICQIENACLGRLATSIDAILLRSLVARAAGVTGLEVLEIGTLFGLGIIAMHEAIAPLFERVHFTALDPLEGYYGKEHRDIVTGVPVSRAVFDENLRRAGIPGDRVTVIQHLSTEAIAMEEARKTCYGLLVIDGDHRYAGVKHDLESYLGTVRPGGYVLVDDYGNPSWPDVKSYVDAEVLGRKDLELVGSDWHTAVFRVAGAH